ncbi:HlyD family secretion protein [Gracilimonas mengyeensis]|uniref:HlyD family secretion protein n=2 Tax=Gracilimonas mengyeensis TaxID=1302730 RepID=A0A521FGC0_9BACT|nr:HlyD family secretion protein [Gracilimonas mengyeensis]
MMNWKKHIVLFVSLTMLITACGDSETEPLQGKLKREEIEITTKVPGRILKMMVQEGDVVQKGDTLAVLDIPEVEAKLRQAEGAWLSAQSQYEMAQSGATKEEREQVEAVFQAAKEQFEFVQKTMERMHEMYKDSLISSQQFDEISAKFKGAKAQYEQARAKRAEVMSGVRSEKINMAKGQMERAKGALEEANVAYNERFVVAPADMDIQTVALEEGELALAGYTIFSGYQPNAPYLRFTVPESRVGSFSTGQQFTIIQPYTNDEFTAKLVSVRQLAAYANKTSSYPNYAMGESIYEIKLIPDAQDKVAGIYTNTTVLIKQ